MKTPFKSCRKQSKGTPIYRLPKYGRWRPSQQICLLTVDRQRSNLPLGRSVDRPVDRKLGNDPAVDCPVDQPTVRFLTVVPAVDRSVDRKLANDPAVDRAISREQRRSGGRPPGRPTQAVHVCAHRSTGAMTDFCPGRPSGRPAEGQV